MATVEKYSRVSIIVTVLQAFSLILIPFIIYQFTDGTQFTKKSEFIASCPTQYGRVVLSMLVAALIANLVTFASAILYDNSQKLSRGLSILSCFLIGAIVWRVWQGEFIDQRFDELASWVAFMAFVGALISGIETRTNSSNYQYWKNNMLYVDLPLMFGCSSILLFKYVVYHESSVDYINWCVANLPELDRLLPDWDAKQNKLQVQLRDIFWVGFSVGSITIQLVSAQVSSVLVRVGQSKK